MSWQPRYPTKFQNAAGTAEFVFPLAEYSFEIEGGLYVPESPLTGAHGGLDLLGAGTAPKQSNMLRLGFTVYEDEPKTVDATVDEMLQKIHSYGRGKLWTSGLNSAGAVELRWTWARAVAMPRLSWQGGDVVSKRALCGFRCEPFWYGENLLEITDHIVDEPQSFAIVSDPDTLVIDNPGNAPIYNAVITLGGTYTNPTITNSNGYRLSTTRDGASADQRVRFDAGRPAVEYSSDAGVTWEGDYTNFVRRTGQIHLMVLDPGENTFTVTGCSSGTLTIDAYAAYH